MQVVKRHCPSIFGDLESPCLESIHICDPRNPTEELAVVAFYYPGQKEVVDDICRSSFLGNFYDLGRNALELQPPCCTEKRSFRNVEAAFQALKFWSRADEFEDLSGAEAFRKKSRLSGPDWFYSGYGSNWKAMHAVLQVKFKPGTPWMQALEKTEDAFLLEHNSVCGRDAIWSDDKFGAGKNWLGLLLMLIRDENTNSSTWTEFLSDFIDPCSGEPWNAQTARRLQHIVKHASDAAVAKVLEVEEQSQRFWSTNPAKGLAQNNQTATGACATGRSQVSQPSSSIVHLMDEPRVIRWEYQKSASLGPKLSMRWEAIRGASHLSAADAVPRAMRSAAANMSVALWKGDITELKVDAIVNPVSGFSRYGLSRAIHSAAGHRLDKEFKEKGGAQLGKPIITKGYDLKAKHVVHADADSLWKDSNLRMCYSTVLDLIANEGLGSVAFPCLQKGSAATHSALSTVRRWLDAHAGKLDCVVFVTFDDSEDEVYAKLLPCYFPRCDDFSLAREDSDDKTWIEFVWNGSGSSVKLAGQFNQWDKSDSASMPRSQDGNFRRVWILPLGRSYEFKFIVDGDWHCRRDLPITKDAQDSENNVIDLTRRSYF